VQPTTKYTLLVQLTKTKMSKSVAYYSHAYYDVKGSFDSIKCDIWYAHKTGV